MLTPALAARGRAQRSSRSRRASRCSHSLGEGGVVAIIAGSRPRRPGIESARLRRSCRSASSLPRRVLVHIWGGVIEAHFHFFVMIVAAVALRGLAAVPRLPPHMSWFTTASWVPLEAAFGLQPRRRGGAPPGKWAAIHGFCSWAGRRHSWSVVAWRLNEDVRAETERAYRPAPARARSVFRERVRARRRSAMALASVDAADSRALSARSIAALCEFTGCSEEQAARAHVREHHAPG